jgi:hypothetical protein
MVVIGGTAPQSSRWAISSAACLRLAELLVAATEEHGRFEEHARACSRALRRRRTARERVNSDETPSAPCQHHVGTREGLTCARLIASAATPSAFSAHHRPSGCRRGSRTRDQGTDDVDVCDGVVAGVCLPRPVDELSGSLGPLRVDADPGVRQQGLQLLLHRAVGDDDQLPRLGVARAARARGGSQYPGEHVGRQGPVLVHPHGPETVDGFEHAHLRGHGHTASP